MLAGALEMRHDGSGGRGYYIAARAHIPAGASLLQVGPAAIQAHAGHITPAAPASQPALLHLAGIAAALGSEACC